MRSTSKCPVTSGWRSSMRQAFAVVPPMSKDNSRSSPSTSAIIGRGERAGRRTALDHSHRNAPGRVDADHAAIAEHDQRRVGEAALLRVRASGVEIGPRDRHRIGVHRRPSMCADIRGSAVRRRRTRRHRVRATSSAMQFAPPARSFAGLSKAVEKRDRDRDAHSWRVVPRRWPRPWRFELARARRRSRPCVPRCRM